MCLPRPGHDVSTMPSWCTTCGKDMKIAAVVVTYNRKALLIECLGGLAVQDRKPDYLYVVDNASSDGTFEHFGQEYFLDAACEHTNNARLSSEHRFWFPLPSGGGFLEGLYMRLNQNSGGAGGFHAGVKKASRDGFDWVLVMDDDAELDPKALHILEAFLNRSDRNKISGLACRKVDHTGNIQAIHRGFLSPLSLRPRALPGKEYTRESIPIDYASFVGLLLNNQAVRDVGYPIKEFFIYCDDIEYCLRLRRFGSIQLVPEAIIVHKDKLYTDPKEASKNIPLSAYWKRYYGIRNLTYLTRVHFKTSSMKTFLVLLLPRIVKVAVTQKDKRQKIALLCKGWLEGVRAHSIQDLQ